MLFLRGLAEGGKPTILLDSGSKEGKGKVDGVTVPTTKASHERKRTDI